MPVTCYDGSQVETYDQCPDITEEWTPAGWDDPETDIIEGTGEEGLRTEGWTPPVWWDDPETLKEDEYKEYVNRPAWVIELEKSDPETYEYLVDNHHQCNLEYWETNGLPYTNFWDKE